MSPIKTLCKKQLDDFDKRNAEFTKYLPDENAKLAFRLITSAFIASYQKEIIKEMVKMCEKQKSHLTKYLLLT